MDHAKEVDQKSTATLRDITEDTVADFLKLEVADSQRRFVASNAVSIAQAHFSKVAWFRGIYADETPVGFIMLSDDPVKPEYFLWRMMVGAAYQKLGFGRKAVELLIAYVKTRPKATELLVSCVEGLGSPLGFYQSLGFQLTGEYEGKEAILKLNLAGWRPS